MLICPRLGASQNIARCPNWSKRCSRGLHLAENQNAKKKVIVVLIPDQAQSTQNLNATRPLLLIWSSVQFSDLSITILARQKQFDHRLRGNTQKLTSTGSWCAFIKHRVSSVYSSCFCFCFCFRCPQIDHFGQIERINKQSTFLDWILLWEMPIKSR